MNIIHLVTWHFACQMQSHFLWGGGHREYLPKWIHCTSEWPPKRLLFSKQIMSGYFKYESVLSYLFRKGSVGSAKLMVILESFPLKPWEHFPLFIRKVHFYYLASEKQGLLLKQENKRNKIFSCTALNGSNPFSLTEHGYNPCFQNFYIAMNKRTWPHKQLHVRFFIIIQFL